MPYIAAGLSLLMLSVFLLFTNLSSLSTSSQLSFPHQLRKLLFQSIPADKWTLVLPTLCAFHAASSFSNSFIVEVFIDIFIYCWFPSQKCHHDLGTMDILLYISSWEYDHMYTGIKRFGYLFNSFVKLNIFVKAMSSMRDPTKVAVWKSYMVCFTCATITRIVWSQQVIISSNKVDSKFEQVTSLTFDWLCICCRVLL